MVANPLRDYGVCEVMFESVKKSWRALRRSRPGSRFQEQYDRNRKERKSRTGRILRIIFGVILLPVGLFFLPAPGPGFVVLALGAVLIARELRFAAVVLDQAELRARRAFAWGQRRWRRLTERQRPARR